MARASADQGSARIVLEHTRVLPGYCYYRAGQEQMLHRREILTTAGESLSALLIRKQLWSLILLRVKLFSD